MNGIKLRISRFSLGDGGAHTARTKTQEFNLCCVPPFFMQMDEQAQAARHLRKILLGQGYDITYRTIVLEDNQKWLLFEIGERQIAIDTASGIWGKASSAEIWRCMSKTCTTSGALLAAEVLIGD